MNKLFFSAIVFFATISAVAQPSISLERSVTSNQQLIEDAVKDGIFIVRRCYQLQDTTAATPTYFGWQNQNWFGKTYSLGIKVKEGYYLFDQAVRPWVYDRKYAPYADSADFAPILSASEYRMLEDTSFQALPYRDLPVKEISTHRVYLAQDTASFHQKGFSVDDSYGVKKGWLAWLVTDKPLEEENRQTPTFLIYRTELTFEQEKEHYEIRDPVTNKHVLGGFYFLPEITEIGQINFILTGALHRENGKWQVVRMKNPTTANAVQPRTVVDGLTPINNEPNNQPDTSRRRRRR